MCILGKIIKNKIIQQLSIVVNHDNIIIFIISVMNSENSTIIAF